MVANRTLWLPGRWLGLCATLALSFTGAPTRAQVPVNDEREGAIEVSLPFSVTQDTSGATMNWSDPSGCWWSDYFGASVWYRFTAAESANVAMNTCGSDYDTLLEVWQTDGSGFPATVVACNDDDYTCWYWGVNSGVTFKITAGAVYYVRVGSYGGGPGGPMTLSGQAIQPPAHDEVTGATPITLPFGEGVDVSVATSNPTDPFPVCGWGGATVWYSLIPDESGYVRVSTCGSSYDTVLSVWRPNPYGGLDEVTCNNDSGECTPPYSDYRSVASFLANSGETYYILVGSLYSDSAGWLQFTAEAIAPPPPNDEMNGATTVTLPSYTDSLDMGAATSAPSDPPFVDLWGNSWYLRTVWYAVTPSERTQIVANTIGSDHDTTISVYRMVEGNPSLVTSDDDSYPFTSWVRFTAEAGQTYYLIVGAYGVGGNLVFSVEGRPMTLTLTPPIPVEAECDAPGGKTVPLVLTVENAAGHETSVSWQICGERIDQVLPAGPAPTTNTITLTRDFCVGQHRVYIEVRDGEVTLTSRTSVSITDSTPPVISLAPLQKVLWPADLTLRNAGTVKVTDMDSVRHVDGLPADGRVLSTRDMGTYQLGPYLGNNAIHLDYYADQAYVPVPPGHYDQFGVLASSSNHSADLDVTIHYSDGSTETVSRGIHAPDWFYAHFTGAPEALAYMDRVHNNPYGYPEWSLYDENWISLYESVFPADLGRIAEGLTIWRNPAQVMDSFNTRTNVMALNARAGAESVPVDLGSVLNRDVVFAGGDWTQDTAGLFDNDTDGTNLVAQFSYPCLQVTRSVTSDEDDVIAGMKKNDSPDMKLLPDGGLRLRAERKDGGDGRVYLIVVKAVDGNGYSSMLCDTVVVPLRNSGSALTVVNWQASQALTYAQQNNGAAPPGFFTVGDGPVVGPRQ